MIRKIVIASILFITLLAGRWQAEAQTAPYKFDFGAMIGMSGYLGDANSASLLKHPGISAEVTARYIANTRFAFRASLGMLTMKGNTAEMADVLPDMASYEFSSTVYDLGVRAEFNFFNYGIGETYKRLKRWTPYLTVGVGACLASSGGHTSVAPTLPMGFGIKFKPRERFNLLLEFTMTKAFGDHLDGQELSDLNQIKTAFYKNTDWYSRISIGFSYEFGKRCETCHYVE
ncbi:MAG: DUF6089 family protein [Muribaculaceae bacterium]